MQHNKQPLRAEISLYNQHEECFSAFWSDPGGLVDMLRYFWRALSRCSFLQLLLRSSETLTTNSIYNFAGAASAPSELVSTAGAAEPVGLFSALGKASHAAKTVGEMLEMQVHT